LVGPQGRPPPDQLLATRICHRHRVHCRRGRCHLARCRLAHWRLGRYRHSELLAAILRTLAWATAMPMRRRSTCRPCSRCSRCRQCGSFRPCRQCRQCSGRRLPMRALTWALVQVCHLCHLRRQGGCQEGIRSQGCQEAIPEVWVSQIQPQPARAAPGRTSKRSRNESSCCHARWSLLMAARSRNKISPWRARKVLLVLALLEASCQTLRCHLFAAFS